MGNDQDNSKKAVLELSAEGFVATTGSSNKDVGEEIINQVARALYLPKSFGEEFRNKTMITAITLMREIGPKDTLEGVLVAQMVATHNASMECMKRAALENQTFEGRNVSLAHAQKLMRLYLDQMKTLNKHRGKSDQKVVIEYVNVAPGAQAIVGNVEMANKDFGSFQTQKIALPQQEPLDINATTKKKTGSLIKNAKRKEQS